MKKRNQKIHRNTNTYCDTVSSILFFLRSKVRSYTEYVYVTMSHVRDTYKMYVYT